MCVCVRERERERERKRERERERERCSCGVMVTNIGNGHSNPSTNPKFFWCSQKNRLVMMMLYKKTKVKGRSPDGDTDFFDIVAGILQGGTLSPYLSIICLDYVL